MTINLLPFVLVIALPLACLTAIVLTACVRRRSGVRGFLRAGPVQFGIEIDPNPPDKSATDGPPP